MAGKKRVHVDITGKQNVDKAAKQATTALNAVQGGAKGMASALSKAGPIAAGVTAGLAAMAVVAKQLTDAYGVQEQAEIRRAAALQATGNVLGFTTHEMNLYATELSRMTGIADESIISAQGVMTTFTKISGEVFPAAMEAAADMSVMFSGDLQQSIVQLGTALNDPITGVGRLKRIGVSFSEDQKKMIEGFMEQNDIMGAQGVILDELGVEFGGVAEKMGGIWTSSVERMKNAFGDLKEQGGKTLAQFLQPAALAIAEWAEGVYDARVEMENLQKVMAGDFEGSSEMEQAIETLRENMEGYQAALENAREQQDKLGDSMKQYGVNYEAIIRARENDITQTAYKITQLEQELAALKEIEEQEAALAAQRQAFADAEKTAMEIMAALTEEGMTEEEKQLALIQERIDKLATYRNGLENESAEYKKAQGYLDDLVEARDELVRLMNAETKTATILDKLIAEATDEVDKQIEARQELARLDQLIMGARADGDAEWLARLLEIKEEMLEIAGIKAEVGVVTDPGADEAPPAEEGPDAAAQAFDIVTGGLEGFASELVTLTMEFGPLGLALAALSEIMTGLMAVVGPLLNEILGPIVMVLQQIGVFLGQAIAPILQALIPIFQTLANMLLVNLMPVFAILTIILERLAPILQALGWVVEQVGKGMLWLYNNAIRHFANMLISISNILYNALAGVANALISLYNAIPFVDDVKKVDYKSLDQGWLGAISTAGLASMGSEYISLDSSDIAYGGSSGVNGGDTSITRVPDIYVYQTFQGPVIGPGGMAEIGEFTVEAIQEFVGAGGSVEFGGATA